LTTTASDGTAVYTYGWDTAFAIPVPEVNKAIVDHKSSPAGFSQPGNPPTYTVSGTFGDWQVCQGGDGKAVRMTLPLQEVNIAYSSGGGFKCSGEAVVEVELHYIPHTAIAASTPGSNPRALVVNPTAATPSLPPFSIIGLSLTPTPGTVTGSLIRAALLDWGTDHLSEFGHVFTVVDLNEMVDKGQWGFVAPNYTSYAYLDGASLDHSTFAVLCMTGTRTGDSLTEQLSPAAIPSGQVAGFVISQARTLYDLVRPAVMQAYPGLNDQNFLMNEDATELYLQDGVSIKLEPIQQDGSTYYPVLTQLSVKSNGNILQLDSFTSTEVAAGITATCQSTHWYTVTLGTSGKGQTLTFKESQPPSIVHAIHQSPGSILTQIIIALVAALALIILTVLTDGAALVVGGLIIGLILGADQIVPALIEKVNGDDSPSIDLLLVNSVDPITWTGSSVFKLGYGSLNVSLQLGGDPVFV
jgi:hypothetical protein